MLAFELFIALAVHDRLVRPYLGDSLAVILLYLILRAALPLRVLPAVATAFAIACVVEFGQLVGILDTLGLRGSAAARTLLGTGYDPQDFLAYAAGAAVALGIESWRVRRAR